MTTVENVSQFKEMRDFFRKLGKRHNDVKMIPFDEPENASVGYVVITDGPGDELSICFDVRFARTPVVEVADRKPLTDEQLEVIDMLCRRPEEYEFDKLLADCVTNKKMVRVDDPKNRRIGFGHFGTTGSRVTYFGLEDFKTSPPELQAQVKEWREAHSDNEYRELAARMLDEEEL